MLHRAASYCSGAEHCIQDVRKKIEAAGLTQEESERIIARLLKEKFIDESRFAKSFVNDKLRFNKWGSIKIGYELQKKNIPADIRCEALEQIDEQEYQEILTSLLKGKLRTVTGKNDQDIFYKLLRFAAGRGFETREAVQCLKQLVKGADYGDDLA